MIKPVVRPMGTYIALYLRISKDKAGRVESVRAQEKWGRAYAAEHWPGVPVRVFADNDLSAANGSIRRPGFEALREAIRAGEVAELWVVEQSRLDRNYEWFPLSIEMDAAGIRELHTNRDGILIVLDEVAGIKAVLAAAEVRKMKRRQADTFAEKAAKGQPPGSRPFGYIHGVTDRGVKTLHIVPAEAAAIREAATLALAGWSLGSIATELSGRGLHGPHRVKVRDASGEIVTEDGSSMEDGGTPVTRASMIVGNSVKSWLTSPTVAGHRVHQNQDLGPGTGNWPAILDEATWRDVRNKLAAPRVVRRKAGPAGHAGPETYPVPGTRTTGRRYLLTGGIAVCGVCGHPLVASQKQIKHGQRIVPYYLCHPTNGGRSCVGIIAEPFEAHVVGLFLDGLDVPAFRTALAADGFAAQRDAITALLKDIDDEERPELIRLRYLPAGDPEKLTTGEWQAARREVAKKEQRLRAELAAIPAPMMDRDVSEIRAAWPDMGLDERRELLGMFIERVAVNRAVPGAQSFDPGRVQPPEWREW